MPRGRSLRLAPAVFRLLARRPELWSVAASTARQHVPLRWWRRAPFLPVPDRAWMGFRLETAYGRVDATPTAEDVIAYLEWCRAVRRAS